MHKFNITRSLSSFPDSVAAQNPKTFLPHETKYFIDLFRYGLIALDIYRVTVHPSGVYILRNSK